MWGASLRYLSVEIPNGPTLIPIVNGPNAPVDTPLLYDVSTFGFDSKPYDNSNGMATCYYVGDFNGNGITDYISDKYYLDAFTDSETQWDSLYPDSVLISKETPSVYLDVDDDGATDYITMDLVKRGVILFGDSTRPLQKQSRFYPKLYSDGSKNLVHLFGRIAGRTCLLRQEWKQPTSISDRKLSYVLEELNQEDLRLRKDTIRTSVVCQSQYIMTASYPSLIINGGDVWWVPSSLNVPELPLRVSLDSIYLAQPHESWFTNDSIAVAAHYLYGPAQWGRQPGRIFNSSTPHFLWYRDSMEANKIFRWLIYRTIVDPQTLETTELGRMKLAPVDRYGILITTTLLIPDIDHDGHRDVMISSYTMHPERGQEFTLVDLYLTSQRTGTGVSEEQHIYPEILTTRTEQGWLLNNAAIECKTNRQVVDLYAIDGRILATTKLQFMNDQLLIVDPHITYTGALFTFIGKCPIRLQ